MKKMAMFAALAAMMKEMNPSMVGTDEIHQGRSKRILKRMKPTSFKRAFNVGFRGIPKSFSAPGSMPAPTIDQVRARERIYGQKIHVKRGLMFFASDGIMWTADEARNRQGT